MGEGGVKVGVRGWRRADKGWTGKCKPIKLQNEGHIMYMREKMSKKHQMGTRQRSDVRNSEKGHSSMGVRDPGGHRRLAEIR